MRHTMGNFALALVAPFLLACGQDPAAPRSLPAVGKVNTSLTGCSNVRTTQVLYNDQWVSAFPFDFDAFTYPGAYPDPLPGSRWLGPTPTASIDAPAGTYHFRTNFKLPRIEENEFYGVVLSGEIHADNSATVLLNGTTIFQHATLGEAENYSDPAQTFSASSGFRGGVNTLAFDLWNEPYYEGPNPSSLDFCYTVTYSKVE